MTPTVMLLAVLGEMWCNADDHTTYCNGVRVRPGECASWMAGTTMTCSAVESESRRSIVQLPPCSPGGLRVAGGRAQWCAWGAGWQDLKMTAQPSARWEPPPSTDYYWWLREVRAGHVTIMLVALLLFVLTNKDVVAAWRASRAEARRDRVKAEAERHERAVLVAGLHRANAFECGGPCCKERRALRAQLHGDVR